MTNAQDQEKISELAQRNLALQKDKEDLLKLNANLNKQLEELTTEKEQLALELRFTNLKNPSSPLRPTKPAITRNDLEKNSLIIFLLITLAGALLLK